MFKRILVPTDGSKLSEEMAVHALELARQLAAEVVFFFATTPSVPDFYGGEGMLIDQASPEELDEAERRRARNVLSALEALAKAAGVPCRSKTVKSDPVFQAIIDVAGQEGCDLICMASHGRRGVRALILGSETQRVLTHSKIPVLVYR